MKTTIVLTFIVCLTGLLGCSDRGTESTSIATPKDLGKVSLSFASSPAEVSHVVARLSRGGYETRSLALAISESTHSASGSFGDVPVGVWHLRVEALDDSSVVRYAGETDVNVPAGQMTQVALQLIATSGGIQITVTWGVPPTPTGGLMAYYPFNGNANDVSGNGNNGVISGAIPTADRFGHLNSAYFFDGVDDNITVASSQSLHPLNQLTIAFWIRPDSLLRPYVPVIHKGGPIQPGWANREYAVYLKEHVGAYYYFLVYSAGNGGGQHEVNSFSEFTVTHQWLFFTGVYDRQNHVMKCYINGEFNSEVFDSYSGFNLNNYPLTIGIEAEEGGSSHGPFRGALDEIRLYNRVLSSAEIQALYTGH